MYFTTIFNRDGLVLSKRKKEEEEEEGVLVSFCHC
jgi:hypothetical protein